MGERGREKGEKQLRNFAKLKRKKREDRRETNSKIRQEKLGICHVELPCAGISYDSIFIRRFDGNFNGKMPSIQIREYVDR